MNEYEGDEEYYAVVDGEDVADEEPVSLPFSWAGVAYEACACVARVTRDVSIFWQELGNQFGHAHNRFVDEVTSRDEGEKFARDVLSGLTDL